MSKIFAIGTIALFVVCPVLFLISMAVNSHRRSLAAEREQEGRIYSRYLRSFSIDYDALQDVLDSECRDISRPGARV